MESELKNIKGIDETAIFRLLWGKRVFIFVVTLLFVVIGFAYTYFRPQIYSVGLELKFEKGDNSYMYGLLGYGKIDFARYAQTGQFRDSCNLYIDLEEQTLLKDLKNQIAFQVNYPDTSIYITGTTSDTLVFGEKLVELGKVLQKDMICLGKVYNQIKIDSLHLKSDFIRKELKNRLEKLMVTQEQYRNSSNIQEKVQVKLAEYEYESFAIFQFRKIDELKSEEKVFDNVKITLSTLKILPNNIRENIFFIFSRWAFFGFIVGCVGAIGYSLVQSLLSKRKG